MDGTHLPNNAGISLHPDWDENFFRTILNLADLAVLVFNRKFQIVYANEYLCDRILGIPQAAAVGMLLPENKTVPDEELQRVVDCTMRVFTDGKPESIENWALHADGSRRLMYWSATPVLGEDNSVRYLLAVGMDVTELRRHQFKLEDMAHRDSLTGLHNRTFFENRLAEDMARAKSEGFGLALLYIDLDGFKPVNDSAGHQAGDVVLRETAARIRRVLRENDVFCRVGGDEFTIILFGVSAKSDTDAIAEQIIGDLSNPFEIDGRSHSLSASIGIAFLREEASLPRELVKDADAAMYQAKQAGKGRVAYAR